MYAYFNLDPHLGRVKLNLENRSSNTINEDDFEAKLIQAFENISLKSSKVRLNGLEAIKKALSRKYLIDFVSER